MKRFLVALKDAGELAVYACNGKKVYGGMAGNSGTTQVNTDGWLSGLYIVRVKTETGERNEKFIIK
ncbi:MAG: T9SS type A sorting domain-containing protein [Prevotella sp.]|nr:T9SS type A sorting domain-containing protein [Prevotella sp.]